MLSPSQYPDVRSELSCIIDQFLTPCPTGNGEGEQSLPERQAGFTVPHYQIPSGLMVCAKWSQVHPDLAKDRITKDIDKNISEGAAEWKPTIERQDCAVDVGHDLKDSNKKLGQIFNYVYILQRAGYCSLVAYAPYLFIPNFSLLCIKRTKILKIEKGGKDHSVKYEWHRTSSPALWEINCPFSGSVYKEQKWAVVLAMYTFAILEVKK